MESIDWINLLLVIIALILLIIIYILYYNFSSKTQTNGISWRIQYGTTTADTDNLLTGGNVLYIARTSANKLNLQINADSANTEGRQFLIKNILTSGNVTLTGSGINFTGRGINGDAPTTISRNQLGWYVYTATNSAFRIS
jgi:di/tricarboxylate transporter